jgi:hypothetical protein
VTKDVQEDDWTIDRPVSLWVAALALAATACASQGSAGPPPSVEGPAVAVRDYQFEPTSLTASRLHPGGRHVDESPSLREQDALGRGVS